MPRLKTAKPPKAPPRCPLCGHELPMCPCDHAELERKAKLIANFERWRAGIATSLIVTVVTVVTVVTAAGQNSPPEAPSKTLDRSFWIASAIGGASTILDSSTTAPFHSNFVAWETWRSSPADPTWHGDRCIAEGSEPWLYGKHPGPGRAYAVGAAKIAAAETVAYLLKRRRRGWLHRLWAMPLLAESLDSSIGAARNLRDCRWP